VRRALVSPRTDGPYKITILLFRKEAGSNRFADRWDHGTTRPYEASQFDRGPFYFLDTRAAEPKSRNGLAPFDTVTVVLIRAKSQTVERTKSIQLDVVR
jgi:hypothetical protein